MAEKLEVTLSKGTAVVSHRGDEVTVDLPEWLNVSQETFFSEAQLYNHCVEHGILLATLQEGFAQHLINVRAKARPADLPPERTGKDAFDNLLKEGYTREQALKMTKPTPQDITADGAQERVDGYKPEAREPSEQANPKKAIEKLKKMGFTKAQILEMLED